MQISDSLVQMNGQLDNWPQRAVFFHERLRSRTAVQRSLALSTKEARDLLQKKGRKILNGDQEADIGIGVLIIFIAIVLVAAIAASLLLYSASLLQQQAQRSADEATGQVAGGMYVVNLAGDRNLNGSDSTVVYGMMPVTDDTPPSGGMLNNVTVTADGISPLAVSLNWTSATDYASGLAEERVYRTEVIDLTNPDIFNEAVAAGRMTTLTQVKNTDLIGTVTSGFGQYVEYTDYSVRDDTRTSYAYAIIGIDRAGNEVIYSPTISTTSTSAVTLDEDVTPPAGGSMTSATPTSDYTVAVFWVPATDAGSGILKQDFYMSTVPFTAPAASVVDGRTVLTMGPEAELVETFNATVSSYIAAPSSEGTYYYGILATDMSGNQFFCGSTSVAVSGGDDVKPGSVESLIIRQGQMCLALSWESAEDGESGIGEYRIYKGTARTAIDTMDELMVLTPLAVLPADSTSYRDYSGVSGTLYYYIVEAVDAAGNLADPVYPTNIIQMIEIKVKPLPGSRAIQFDSMMIEITDGMVDATIAFNRDVFGPEGATATTFSVEILRDPDGEFSRSHSLSDGALVKIYINAAEIGLTLHSGADVSIKFLPKLGYETIELFTVPAMTAGRYIQMI
ncbi:MAG TPA: hypothetical protein ENN25_02570 [Euryarchaeota archaeon]|nr:hypothetical protein [Euryarchaeota archaeon]